MFDFIFVVHWWIVFLILGAAFLPVTIVLLEKLKDNGYIFSKVIAFGVISYAIFILGFFKLLRFNELTLLIVFVFFLLINLFIARKINIAKSIRKNWRVYVFEEILFFVTLALWSFVRGHNPEIHGLEKFMDVGFVNSILRADFMPPRDMWLTPFPINYYYFGHLITAVLTKASMLPSQITYNLMMATLFAFTFVGSFSILFNIFRSERIIKSYAVGLLSGFLVAMSGNLTTIYTFFKPYVNEHPVPFWQQAFAPLTFPNAYWYPNATRFIPFTIHEFPIYSFVVSDLHGHVIDIPFVLLGILLIYLLFITKNWKLYTPVISFLVALMYMTNAWDGLIYLMLAGLVVLLINFYPFKINKTKIKEFIFSGLILGGGFFLFSLPFNVNFVPFVSGIGVICAPEALTNMQKLGPFLFEADHCQRSPIWQLVILYGFFYFLVASFLVIIARKKNEIKRTDLFVLILIFISTLLLLVPEFIYAKDIYPGHYRANTMFKLGYEAFMMLSISSAYIIGRILTFGLIKSIIYKIWLPIFFFLLFLVSIYPYFSTYSFYGELKNYRGLDGLRYIQDLYKYDYDAILWINENIKSQPVILEAQGDSYTDFARISANTGLPTVLGWTVHEWLWRGTYDIPAPRITQIKQIYEGENTLEVRGLLKQYKIEYVYIGGLEDQTYKVSEDKFKKLGERIYQKGNVKIYKINLGAI